MDFTLILVLATLVSGLIWLADLLFFKPARKRKADTGTEGVEVREPLLVDYARSFFPVLLVVLVLRSFVAEPFRIPSGSMMPTLLVGDFILVNKFAYGLRLPVLDTKVVPVGEPKRGDVVVFRYPEQSAKQYCSQNYQLCHGGAQLEISRSKGEHYIKRIIGLPGDEVRFAGDKVFVNGKLLVTIPDGVYKGDEAGRRKGVEKAIEVLPLKDGGKHKHEVLISHDSRGLVGTVKVPKGKYFVMGDNRDRSFDSRFWGFVPEKNLVGKAFMIWLHWDWKDGGFNWHRIGKGVH